MERPISLPFSEIETSSLLTSPTTNVAPKTKIVRNLSLKRMKGTNSNLNEKVKLDHVLGLTLTSNCSFSSHSSSATVAYPAGCVCVLLDTRRNKQSHILNNSKKAITSLAFSPDGKYVITGECGHQPCVRLWDAKTGTQLSEFEGHHKYEVACVAFSPNSSYAVSIGSQHDMLVNVWDWKNNIKVASNKISAKVKALSFSQDGKYFVTVGVRHVKFWYLDFSRPRNSTEPVPLMGRSAILADHRNNNFCDVGCGKGSMAESTYAITESGLLCEFNGRRLLDKWVELRTTRAYSLVVGQNMICIGCAEGIVRIFNPNNLHFICTLPRPHALGTDLAKVVLKSESMTYQSGNNAKYADTIAITLLEESKRVVCVYSDHSMYIWDLKDTKRVGKCHSYLYHSACIWGIEPYRCTLSGSSSLLPPGTFLTCSSDDTVRVWNLESHQNFDGYVYRRNIFSHELLKIFYMDPDLKFLCDSNVSASSTSNGGSSSDNNGNSNGNNDNGYDGKNGIRCLKISPDGKHLSTGDRSGNINVKDFATQKDLCKIEAHDSEVLCLEYSTPTVTNDNYFLSSASRDRLIHVFDVKQQYSFFTTLDDHSAAITAIRFTNTNSNDTPDESLKLLSCGTDKSIIIRKMKGSLFTREHHVVSKTTFYDMELDKENNCTLTACQDRQIRMYDLDTGKLMSTYKGSSSDDGTLIKIAMDPSGLYFATSCTDKSLNVFDYKTGDCVATAYGHSEVITGLKFSSNGRNLISVSGDGCIFIWKLPVDIANAISCKLGLPPVPPEKPAFISALRMFPSDKIITSPQRHKSTIEITTTNSRVEGNSVINSTAGDTSSSSTTTATFESPKITKWSQRSESSSSSPWSRNNSQIFDEQSSLKDKSTTNDERDSDSMRTSSVRSDEEVPSSNSDIVYYPQDDEPYQKNNFEIRQENRSVFSNGGSNNSFARQRLKTSMSVPNFNDLNSDDEEKDISRHHTRNGHSNHMRPSTSGGGGAGAGGAGTMDTWHRQSSSYMSTENLSESQHHNRSSRYSTLQVNRGSREQQSLALQQRESSMGGATGDGGDSESVYGRSSISMQHHRGQPVYRSQAGAPAAATTSTLGVNDLQPLSRSTSVCSVAGKGAARREELTKAVSEARRKLESLGWKGNLSSSRSVADLTLSRPTRLASFSTLPSSSVLRSNSMSDLSFGRPRRILQPASNVSSAIWDRSPSRSNLASQQQQQQQLQQQQQQHLDHLSPFVGDLKKSPSISSMMKTKHHRPMSSKTSPSQGPWASPAASLMNYNTARRSGRASAPLNHRGNMMNGSHHGTQSSDDETSSDEESSSSFVRTLRPGTPPKPSILRQVRRSSTSHVLQPNSHHSTPKQESSRHKTRKLWDNFELRSSRSEYNLSFVGREPMTGAVSRSGSRANLMVDSLFDNRIDFSASNPATIELNKETCEQAIEELNYMAIFVRKLYKRAHAANSRDLLETLTDGVNRTHQTLSIVAPGRIPAISSPLVSSRADADSSSGNNSLPPEPSNAITMNFLQAYSDRLVSIVEQRMTAKSTGNRSSTDL